MALPDPVIHLYLGYALVRAKEMFNVTLPTGVCGAHKPNAWTGENHLPLTSFTAPGKNIVIDRLVARNERRKGTGAKRRNDPRLND